MYTVLLIIEKNIFKLVIFNTYVDNSFQVRMVVAY